MDLQSLCTQLLARVVCVSYLFTRSKYISRCCCFVKGHISTDPGSALLVASGPSESVHTTAGKKALKRAIKTKAGSKGGMCPQWNFVHYFYLQG